MTRDHCSNCRRPCQTQRVNFGPVPTLDNRLADDWHEVSECCEAETYRPTETDDAQEDDQP